MLDDDEITDYNYIGSSIGNAFFSGVSYRQLWECVVLSKTREELDAAVEICIKLNRIAKRSTE